MHAHIQTILSGTYFFLYCGHFALNSYFLDFRLDLVNFPTSFIEMITFKSEFIFDINEKRRHQFKLMPVGYVIQNSNNTKPATRFLKCYNRNTCKII